ncbi:LacI family DNA-binding transcriptional regulator [Georgenia sp. Z1491]|uniref:LacI family DNA-binding transcriptional regulator n=1 Tax=Georgenia sp. Z1491 TaxID=3416707 RepID=UPI003CEDBAEF
MSTDGEARRIPTIYDVAAAAGVSPSTVSRALARPGRVSAETAERVREVAAEIGYRRSAVAPALGVVPSKLLAMVVADIGNPLFVDVFRGAEVAAGRAGYTMLLFDAREAESRERAAAESFLDFVEGFILASPRMSDSALLRLAKQRPVVVLNRMVSGLPSVLTDGARGVRRVAEHLGSLGHREVAYIGGPEASWADGVRWRGLQEAGEELALRVRRIGPNEPTVVGGELVAARWSRSQVTAVVTFNDVMAIGFVRGLRAQGLEVPTDVSVVGFDNSRLGALATPAITSVASPLALQGRTAVGNLLAIVKGARPPRQPVLLPVKLVPRESTGPVGGASGGPAGGASPHVG